ncbi:P-loop containing nucleoside triphosphate hydrolase protein [Ophiobolus disseminans]|uniref:P-loop containing nucleoside triphosphate hydrolase protein n=1 Tax=Ophiobolus disseminans TaxID=1469910 RepID=A0A6A6ZTA4_9PLEO|nr:P-loop containing nucleoside triphosphate hydrolase protein [Ophiobolus disseminans]
MDDEDIPLTSPSSHRLPTVSASQALHSLHARGARTVSTGISQLNNLLLPPSLPGHDVSGGYMRGKVTEIFGPSGVGKTSFGIQAAASALRERQHVVWLDAACAAHVPHRLLDVLSAPQDPPLSPPGSGSSIAASPSGPGTSRDEVSSHFHHLAAPTLAHVLALFVHSPASFPPPNTSLVIIDSFSMLVDSAYPRNLDAKNKDDQSRWSAGRRFTVINELISTFSRFAALHDIALLVTCQTITRIRGASRAVLVPAISGVEWENGVSTRLVLFRDWVRQEESSDTADGDRLRVARFAGLVKLNGVALADECGVGSVVLFAIENSGLRDIGIGVDNIAARILPAQARPLKRPFADLEEDAGDGPNSDELYGWIEDDEVATEGLLIDEAPIPDAVDTAASRSEGHSSKMTRPSTV